MSLSGNGNIVAIGATEIDGNGDSSGHVRVYTYQNSVWVQHGEDIDGESEYDSYGISVSLSGNGKTVAIGAHYNDGNGTFSGNVRVYKYNTSWVQSRREY